MAGSASFLCRECDENFEHRLDEDFGLFRKVVHLEKIVELRWVKLYPLGSFVSVQIHVENFVPTWIEFLAVQVVQGDDHQLVDR